MKPFTLTITAPEGTEQTRKIFARSQKSAETKALRWFEFPKGYTFRVEA